MSFSSPLWLLGLLPWAAAVLLLLIGRLRRVKVPFLQLWQGPAAKPRDRRFIEPPPLALALAMLAMLLAVLAAARPVIRTWGILGPRITIIVDRSVTMSARGIQAPRFQETIDLAAAPIRNAFDNPVELLTIPPRDPIRADFSDWPSLAKAMPPTAVDSADSLRHLVVQRLAETTGPVIVLSDQPLSIQDDRLIQIPPEAQLQNVGIVRFAARETPAGQVMVRLRNQSALTRAALRLSIDSQQLAPVAIDLPGSGEHDYFLDLPATGRIISVELLADDDLAADNRAYLVREQAWPIVEQRAALPLELQRMIDLYSRLRPASEGSARIAIVASTDALPGSDPAAVLAAATTRPAGQLKVADHPITRSITDWPAVLKDAAGAPAPGDLTWTTLISIDGQPLLAAREQPLRQVWVGFSSQSFPASPDFVIFWTSVFNWLGQGGQAYASHPIAQLPSGWWVPLPPAPPTASYEPGLWPGVYSRGEGVLRAVNAVDVRIPPLPATDWRGALSRMGSASWRTGADRPLAVPLIFLALAAMVASVITWRRVNRGVAPGRAIPAEDPVPP